MSSIQSLEVDPLAFERSKIDEIDDQLLFSLGAIATVAPHLFGNKINLQEIGFYSSAFGTIQNCMSSLLKSRYEHTNNVGRIKYVREKSRLEAVLRDLGLSYSPDLVQVEVKHPAREKEIIERLSSLAIENELEVEHRFIEDFWGNIMNDSCTRQRISIGALKAHERRGERSAA